MRGLYILETKAIQLHNTIKIGMTLDLERRWYDYTDVFNNPYYLYCFVVNEEKKKILSLEKKILEKKILDKTINEHNNNYASEYRSLNNLSLNDYVKIIKDVLNEYNIEYEILVKPIYKKPKVKLNEEIDRTKELEKIISIEMYNEREKIQNDYLKDIKREITINHKSLIKAPTGFGKTNIMFKLINTFLFDVCVIFTPRLLLNKQMERTGFLLSNGYSFFNFSKPSEPIETLKIKKKEVNKIIIVLCYPSGNKLQDFITKNKISIDLVVFDEAHCIPNKSEDNFWLSTKCIKNRFFMTATPYKSQENNPLYGKCIEKIKVYELIIKRILCNFKTVFKKLENVKEKYINLSEFVLDSMKEFNKKKGIVYINKQMDAECLYELMRNQSDVNIYLYISKKTKFDGKFTDISNFEKDKKPSVIITCNKIDYGYDNVFIDLICFGNSRHGKINIRQICGRGFRNNLEKYPNKVLHILLPIYFDEFEKKFDSFKKYLDYIIGECGSDIIYDEDIKQFRIIGNENNTNFDGGIIPMEIYNEYCSVNGFTGFMTYLKSSKVIDEISYNKIRSKDENKWMPELGDIRKRYSKFCFRELRDDKDKFYDTLKKCLIKKDEIIKKYKIDTTEMLENKINKMINHYDSKIPVVDLELFYKI